MGIKYLWDTNTVIYYLQNQFSPGPQQFMDELLKEFRPAISSISEIELLCWKTPTEKDKETLVSFINDSIVFELEQNIKLKTAEIRKSTRLKLPDAIIAGTALVHDLTLLTRNISDFKKIEMLRLSNPWEEYSD